MTKELAGTVFVSALGTSTGSLLVIQGGKYLIKRASLQIFQKIVVILGGKITQQALKSAVSKWLPGIGAAAMAAWTNYMTRQVGHKAKEIFRYDIEVEPTPIENIELIKPLSITYQGTIGQKSNDYYKIQILINLAKIDGTVDYSEAEFIAELIENSDLSPNEKIDFVAKISSNDHQIDGINILAESPDDSIALLADMTALAMKDGNFHFTEKLYIRQIGKMLNFTDNDINEVIRACAITEESFPKKQDQKIESKESYKKINDPAASYGVLTDDSTQQAVGYVSRRESKETSLSEKQIQESIKSQKPLSENQAKKIKELRKAHERGFLSDKQLEKEIEKIIR